MDDKIIIDDIRNSNNIVDVISSYIPLIKKGRNYFCVCPFHDDTNPSMSVSEEKQIYKCFSCGKSGNVFNFVMDYEKVDFREALNILAKRCGKKLNNITTKSTDKYDRYYKMYDIAVKLYQNNINTSFGEGAIDYLNKRDINDELIKVFKIGLSTNDRNSLTNLLLKKDYSKKEMEDYGLGNGMSDLYINRIMFPLFNTSGVVVGFSGRIYNGSKSESKYINTKETKIFKKGELLYNYHNAKEEARTAKSLIVVEGFMDVIRLYSIGIKNVVALMGTSLTKEQITLIKRTSLNVYLCMDGDGPGKHANIVNGEALVKDGLNVKVIDLKEGLDPDEYVLKYKSEGFKLLYDNALVYTDYKINSLKEGKNFSSIEDKTNYINNVLLSIEDEKDEIKQELILNKLSKEFDIDVEILRKKLQNGKKSSKIEALKKEPVVNTKVSKYMKATYVILYSMLNSYDACKAYETKLNYLPDEVSRLLANDIVYYYKMYGSLNIADFITTLNGKESLKELLDKVLEVDNELEISSDSIDDYIKVIKDYNVNQEIKRLKEKMEKEIDYNKKVLIAEEIRHLKMGVEA